MSIGSFFDQSPKCGFIQVAHLEGHRLRSIVGVPGIKKAPNVQGIQREHDVPLLLTFGFPLIGWDFFEGQAVW